MKYLKYIGMRLLLECVLYSNFVPKYHGARTRMEKAIAIQNYRTGRQIDLSTLRRNWL